MNIVCKLKIQKKAIVVSYLLKYLFYRSLTFLQAFMSLWACYKILAWNLRQ